MILKLSLYLLLFISHCLSLFSFFLSHSLYFLLSLSLSFFISFLQFLQAIPAECFGGEEASQPPTGPKRMRQNSAYLLLYDRVPLPSQGSRTSDGIEGEGKQEEGKVDSSRLKKDKEPIKTNLECGSPDQNNKDIESKIIFSNLSFFFFTFSSL